MRRFIGIARTHVLDKRWDVRRKWLRHPISAWRLKTQWYDSLGDDGKYHFWDYTGG